MGIGAGYITGLFLCWGASIFGALGNVLFKYHNILRKEKDDYPRQRVSYWHLAVAMILTGSIASVISFALIPLSINCVHAALPILLGEVFSGWVLPHSKLDASQWVLIFFILCSVTGVVFCGDHNTSNEVTREIEENFLRPEALVFISFNLIGGFCAFLTLFLNPLPDPVVPCSLFNISGPVMTAALGNCTQVSARVCMTILKCGISTCDDSNHVSPAWYTLFCVLPVCAVCQLMGVSFTMRKLHLVTVIPIYGTLLIVMPSLSGILIMHESPSNTPWYLFFMSLIVVFNVAFVYKTQQRKSEEVPIDEPLIVDSIAEEPLHANYASILSQDVEEHDSNANGGAGEIQKQEWTHSEGNIQDEVHSQVVPP